MSHEAAKTWLSQATEETMVVGAKASDDPLGYLVEAGAKDGFEFTATELIHAAGQPADEELSEAQLERVAGGVTGSSPVATFVEGLGIPPPMPTYRDGDGGVQIPEVSPVGNVANTQEDLQDVLGVDAPGTQIPSGGPINDEGGN